jgi:hypothetical protein
MPRRPATWSVTRDDQEQELRALTAELVEVQDLPSMTGPARCGDTWTRAHCSPLSSPRQCV